MEQTLIIALSIQTKNELEFKKSYFGEHLTDHATLIRVILEELRRLVDMGFSLSSLKEGFSSCSNFVFS